jgi:hypothetical protein
MKYIYTTIFGLLLLSCTNKPKQVEPDSQYIAEIEDYFVVKVDTLDYIGETYHYKRITYWMQLK